MTIEDPRILLQVGRVLHIVFKCCILALQAQNGCLSGPSCATNTQMDLICAQKQLPENIARAHYDN